MPVTYIIDSAEKTIRTTCSSPLTFEQVIEHFRALQRDPACAGYLDVMLDVSEADTLPERQPARNAVSAEVRALRKKVQFGACGIVAARDAIFGMMRVFEVLSGEYFGATRVFPRESAEAEAWLASQQQPADPGRKV